MESDVPLVDGLTETAPDGDSLVMRLTEFLSRRPGGASQDIAMAISALEQAHGKETDSTVKTRVSAALGLLRGDCAEED